MRLAPAPELRSTAGRPRAPRRRRALATALVALSAVACETSAPVSEGPATVAAPLDAILAPYSLSGTIRIGTSQCQGGALRRVANTSSVVFRDINFAQSGVFATATLGPTGTEDERPYSATLQRDVGGDLITYQWRNNSNPTWTFSKFPYGGAATPGSSREFRWAVGDFTSPANAVSLTQDVVAADAVSLTVELETDHRPASDPDSANDDVVRVFVGASALNAPYFSGLFNSAGCYSPDPGALNINDTPCTVPAQGATAQTVNGFIRRNILDTNGAVTAQRTQVELLLLPGRDYSSLLVRAELRDGIVLEVALPSPISASQASPCASLMLSPETQGALYLARAPQTLQGDLHLAPDDAIATVGGPRPTAYFPAFNDQADASLRVGYTSNGSLISLTPTDWSTPLHYEWHGVAPGNYYMKPASAQALAGFMEFGHVRLSWGDSTETALPGYRPEFRAVVNDNGSGVFYPLYRYPTRVPEDVGLDAAGYVAIAPDATVTVDRIVPMAYLRGKLELNGCDLVPGNIGSGAAELKGVANTQTSGGLARGLFRAGDFASSASDGPGHFEVAASAGDWRLGTYRIRLDGAGNDPYDGHIAVWLTDQSTHTLVAGRVNQNTDLVQTPHELTLNKVAVTLHAAPGYQMRNPVLSIGRDTSSGSERVAFTNAAGTSTLGSYTAVSRWETSAIPASSSESAQLTPVIFAMTNSAVAITASAEVCDITTDCTVAGNWSATGFDPPDPVSLAGACGICIIDANTSVQDDEFPPSISINGDLDLDPNTAVIGPLAPGTQSFVLNGTAIDGATPVVNLTVGGPGLTVQALPVADNSSSQSLSTTLNGLVEGANVFTIVARDCVGNTRTVTLTINVAAPLCPAADTPDMCEGDSSGTVSGSAFWIDLVGPNSQSGALLCTVAAPGQAPVCNPSDPDMFTTTAQCGN